MPITSVTQQSMSSLSQEISAQPKTRFIGMVDDIQNAFPNKVTPCYQRGTMQGEGVISSYDKDKNDNYLYSLNAQTCVIATLYNCDSKIGAIIHFDHNISNLIQVALTTTIDQLRKDNNQKIASTLSGGVWFMAGDSIGEPVKSELFRQGITPSWDQWSFCPCIEHNYGVVLNYHFSDLKNNVISNIQKMYRLIAKNYK